MAQRASKAHCCKVHLRLIRCWHLQSLPQRPSHLQSETALLIAVGTARSGYQLEEDLRVRALIAFEAGALSENALVKLLA